MSVPSQKLCETHAMFQARSADLIIVVSVGTLELEFVRYYNDSERLSRSSIGCRVVDVDERTDVYAWRRNITSVSRSHQGSSINWLSGGNS